MALSSSRDSSKGAIHGVGFLTTTGVYMQGQRIFVFEKVRKMFVVGEARLVSGNILASAHGIVVYLQPRRRVS